METKRTRRYSLAATTANWFERPADILLVEGALRWSWMLLSFSALSFLGFGVAPPTPDWGLMIANSRDLLALAPWASFFPIAAISTLIIGVNLLAGALAKAIGLDRGGGSTI